MSLFKAKPSRLRPSRARHLQVLYPTMLLNSFNVLPSWIVPRIIVVIVVETMVVAEETIMGPDPIPIEAA